MLFGSHVSAAGGLWNAPINAAAVGCEVFQFFSRPPQGGPGAKLDPETVKKFRTECEKGGFDTYVTHAPYIINFASVEDRIRNGSIRLIREELERGTILGVKATMFHPGSARDVDEKTGVKMVAKGIKEVLKGYRGSTKLLVEISAGSGKVIGDTFDEIGAILKMVDSPKLGVCFDTAHAFASGYDIRTEKGVKDVFNRFDKEVGIEHLMMSHCNDSKVELGTRKDRHDHIGEGHIGMEGFIALMKEKRLKEIFWIVETPPERQAEDVKKMKQIRDAIFR